MSFVSIAGLVLRYAPDAIAVVERLLKGRPSAEKRVGAAREVFELVMEFVEQDQADDWKELAKLDAKALAEAAKDEERFIEETAKVNDALVQFTNYVNSYKE